MFTGIVTASGKIAAVGGEGGDRVLRIETDWDCLSIPIGASISHAGICLTVTARDATGYEVAASAETMSVSLLRLSVSHLRLSMFLPRAIPPTKT